MIGDLVKIPGFDPADHTYTFLFGPLTFDVSTALEAQNLPLLQSLCRSIRKMCGLTRIDNRL